MTFDNLGPDQKKQLIEFYKAMKVAAKMFSKGPGQNALVQLADQIIVELKKDQPDEEKLKSLAERLQMTASANG